jgi:hypothetical protein
VSLEALDDPFIDDIVEFDPGCEALIYTLAGDPIHGEWSWSLIGQI